MVFSLVHRRCGKVVLGVKLSLGTCVTWHPLSDYPVRPASLIRCQLLFNNINKQSTILITDTKLISLSSYFKKKSKKNLCSQL